jgi:hypothetical protein
MQSLGFGKPPPNQVKFSLRRGNPPLSLFLKRVQHVHSFFKSNRVDCAPGVPTPFRYDLEYRRSAESFQRLCRRIGLALLGRIERRPNFPSYSAGERAHVLAS